MSIRGKSEEYAALNVKRWHTPGHKGHLTPLDMTEIDDGEFFPADAVTVAQRKAAEIIGVSEVRFLLGGSSMGIKAAIMSVGGDIIAPVTHHRCVEEGAILQRVGVMTMEQTASSDGLFDPPNIAEVERAIEEYPEAKAVLIVSPDYYGRTAASEVADVVHRAGKLLIADSAHGAHFPFRKDLFPNCFADIADFCVMSAHKTLLAPTMTSFMSVNNSALVGKLDFNLKLLGTTSPSYPLLAGIEDAVAFAHENAAHYDELKAAVCEFRRDVATRGSDDFTRIVVDARDCGMSGKQLYDALFKVGHAAEMYDNRFVVFIVTLSDTREDIDELKQKILRIVNER